MRNENTFTMTEEREEREEKSPKITLSPPESFNKNADSFNKEDTFSDLDFIIAGLEKPLKLHKNIISQTSMFAKTLLKAKHASKSADCNEIRWMYDTSKEVDREALVKALRFCYGDTITQLVWCQHNGHALHHSNGVLVLWYCNHHGYVMNEVWFGL